MGKKDEEYSPMVGLLAKNLNKLNDIVHKKNVEDSAFFERMLSCQEDAIKTYHAMFLDNGESVVSKLKEYEKRIARLEKDAIKNRESDKEIKIAWIKVIGIAIGSILTILGTVYLAFLKLTGA